MATKKDYTTLFNVDLQSMGLEFLFGEALPWDWIGVQPCHCV